MICNGDDDGNNGFQGMAPGESTDDGKFTIVGCYPVQQCTMCRLSGSIVLQVGGKGSGHSKQWSAPLPLDKELSSGLITSSVCLSFAIISLFFVIKCNTVGGCSPVIKVAFSLLCCHPGWSTQ